MRGSPARSLRGRHPAAFAAAAIAWILLPAASAAHRLDEYLQATRVSIGRERTDVEIDLTPGVAVADEVLAAIDTDRNGVLSAGEGESYARTVLAAISVELDGLSRTVRLRTQQLPAPDAAREGVGTIRLRATVDTPAAEGPHALVYRNVHWPGLSVYLANALVPDDPAIEITRQSRDPLQHELRIDYRIAGGQKSPGWAGLLAALVTATVATLAVWRRRQGTDRGRASGRRFRWRGV